MTPSFPLRVAAIDVGSNAMRFLAAEFNDAGWFATLDYVRAPVRMGHDAFRSGRLSGEIVEAGLETLADFHDRMRSLEIPHYRAVATSAVRDSRNGAEFVERAWAEAGVRLEPITGIEEARLVWLAIARRVDLGDRQWILVDLGGGSVEISLVDAEQVHWSESQPLGTVRLLEEIEGVDGPDERTPQAFRRMLEDHTAMLEISAIAGSLDVAGMIATGGNIEALAELAGAATDELGVARLPLERLRGTLDDLARLTPAERMERHGLRADRADVIVPAAMVYERIARMVGATEVIVPEVGVKEGVLLDVVDDLLEHGAHGKKLEREVLAGAVALGRRYRFDEAHGRQVARLALSLFDQLAGRHELEDEDRRVLLAAALLHDVGQFISYRKHHKHSHYLILNSELPGFAPSGIERVALVARYHRRAEPRDGHEGWEGLGGEPRERVRRLAAILRMADALDRGHGQQVRDVGARVDDGVLEIVLDGSGDLLPEQWALQKKARMFESVFELPVRCRVDAEASR